jgi:hypothetical protein
VFEHLQTTCQVACTAINDDCLDGLRRGGQQTRTQVTHAGVQVEDEDDDEDSTPNESPRAADGALRYHVRNGSAFLKYDRAGSDQERTDHPGEARYQVQRA